MVMSAKSFTPTLKLFRPASIDWCHLVDRHRPTAWDTTRKLVVPQAVGADQPNDTSLQHLGFTWLVKLSFEILNDLPGQHSCCGGSIAQPRAARSDVTWPLSKTTDEVLASGAGAEEESVDSGQIKTARSGVTWPTKNARRRGTRERSERGPSRWAFTVPKCSQGKNKYQTLDNGVGGVAGNAALVALVARHENVALVTPSDTPAVLHLPVGLSLVGTVADHRYSVVKLSRAGRLVVQATLVEHKGRLAGVNAH
ncbi:hypothetical protein TYRP_009807 [Tyrophagus putrescentiae]|nr:hypothetical protein TYRP_009807 [Tyrophagus putrescentiae]